MIGSVATTVCCALVRHITPLTSRLARALRSPLACARCRHHRPGLHALLRTERFDSPKDQMEAAAASVSAQAAAPGAVYTATSTPGHAGADPIVGEA